jgi:hypothetical protein
MAGNFSGNLTYAGERLVLIKHQDMLSDAASNIPNLMRYKMELPAEKQDEFCEAFLDNLLMMLTAYEAEIVEDCYLKDDEFILRFYVPEGKYDDEFVIEYDLFLKIINETLLNI